MSRRTTAVAMMVAILASAGVPLRAAADPGDAQARAGHHILVYESSRPALQISITRKGDRMTPVSIGGPGKCADGTELGSGFGLIGRTGIPVAADGTFDGDSGSHRIFRGHFERDRVIGVFEESFLNVGGDPDAPTRCGNIVPQGRLQRFVAHLVERDGKAVPHPPIKVGYRSLGNR